jgi:hypothetical protein
MSRLLACATALLLVACPKAEPPVVEVERSTCLACHRPIQADGSAHGIEEAHPKVNGLSLSCVDCHGGDNTAPAQKDAHVRPQAGGDDYLKNLALTELDDVDESFLRFVNPGDLRVAMASCGGSGCHREHVDHMVTNSMATFAGELGVARYRAGSQGSSRSVKSVYDVRDPDFAVGERPGTVGTLARLTEPSVSGESSDIGDYLDLYLTKACMRCHLWSYGENRFTGDYRSSGCTACHMNYADDGLSLSADPTIEKDSPAHPIKHVLTQAIPTTTCMHCHYRGGRIGPNFMGMREAGGPGTDPPAVGYLGEALHGHDANYYITDEDLTNDHDETPPDVHFEAGMHCIDCHTSNDVHGDGHLYSDSNLAVELRCESCHGSSEAVSTLTSRLGRPIENLSQDSNGAIWLRTKVSGKTLRVPQIKEAIDRSDPSSYLHRSMGRNESGFSHLDNLSCDACHSSWQPNCYGCHVEVDMSETQRSLISGNNTPGKLQGGRKWVATDDLILMHNTDGKITPSMPSERLFFTARNGDGELTVDNEARRSRRGEIGHGQRAFHPHTIRRWSPWMRCDRCHQAPDDPDNLAHFNQAVGYGTDKYLETGKWRATANMSLDDAVTKTWRLDRIQDPETHEPTVLVGHDEPQRSRPLSAEMIARMWAVVVEAPDCPVPGDVAVPFSIIQSSILSPSCLDGCHDADEQAAGLDLSPEAAYASLVGRPASTAAGKTLVVPSDPASSYLLEKILESGTRTGARMPSRGAPLVRCQEEMIEGWIRAGARKD